VLPLALVLLVCNMDRICLSVAILPMAQEFGWPATVQVWPRSMLSSCSMIQPCCHLGTALLQARARCSVTVHNLARCWAHQQQCKYGRLQCSAAAAAWGAMGAALLQARVRPFNGLARCCLASNSTGKVQHPSTAAAGGVQIGVSIVAVASVPTYSSMPDCP
jgi:hypothetical protein